MEWVLRENTRPQNNVTSRRIVFYVIFLPGYALLNASQTSTNSARNTCSHLRNFREQRPSDKSDLDLSVTGKTGREHCTGVNLRKF